jgi:hypothetical protein
MKFINAQVNALARIKLIFIPFMYVVVFGINFSFKSLKIFHGTFLPLRCELGHPKNNNNNRTG